MNRATTRVAKVAFGHAFMKSVGWSAGLLTTSFLSAAFSMHILNMVGPVLASTNENFLMAPPGAIVPFYLSSCPQGWLPADGTNETPDLRGRFVRGRDDSNTARPLP